MRQFIFNPIVNKKADRHRNSTVNELRIFPEPNFTWFILEHFVPNILQNSTNFLRSWHEKVGKVLRGKADSEATKRLSATSKGSKGDNSLILLQKVLNCTPFSCIWITFWPKFLGALPQNPQWRSLQRSPYPLTAGTSH